MSERLRAPLAHPSPPERELSSEDLRRQLEGRMEVLEAARERYATLEKKLKGLGWKRRLRAQADFLQEVLDQEDSLYEAVTRARRRMEAEGWPETLPALEPLRDVLRRRERVGALVRQRLVELSLPLGTPDLRTELALLRSVLVEAPASAPPPEETRIMEMRREATHPLLLPLMLPVFGAILEMASDLLGLPGVLLVAGGFLSLVALIVARTGEFWLTSERLVWKPVFGRPVSVSLRSIRPGGIQVGLLSSSVRVQGDRIVHVRHVKAVEKLAALLEMHRQPPLLGASRGGLRLPDVSIYEALLKDVPGKPMRQGMAILRPGGISFVPRGSGRAALKALTGEPPPEGWDVDVSWVLEELRWLPEAEFDACLARVVEATGGVQWSAWEARRTPGVPVWKEIHISHGTQSLAGKVDWAQQAAAERVFKSWPSVEP